MNNNPSDTPKGNQLSFRHILIIHAILFLINGALGAYSRKKLEMRGAPGQMGQRTTQTLPYARATTFSR